MTAPQSNEPPNNSLSNVQEFIERAKAGGASEQSLVGILTARGWPEKEVYEALAAHYERTTAWRSPADKDQGQPRKMHSFIC